eukprot:7222974-Pyramimonas_sp.AAC.1
MLLFGGGQAGGGGTVNHLMILFGGGRAGGGEVGMPRGAGPVWGAADKHQRAADKPGRLLHFHGAAGELDRAQEAVRTGGGASRRN